MSCCVVLVATCVGDALGFFAILLSLAPPGYVDPVSLLFPCPAPHHHPPLPPQARESAPSALRKARGGEADVRRGAEGRQRPRKERATGKLPQRTCAHRALHILTRRLPRRLGREAAWAQMHRRMLRARVPKDRAEATRERNCHMKQRNARAPPPTRLADSIAAWASTVLKAIDLPLTHPRWAG